MCTNARADLAKRTAGEVMTANPITVAPETSLLDALRLLLQHIKSSGCP